MAKISYIGLPFYFRSKLNSTIFGQKIEREKKREGNQLSGKYVLMNKRNFTMYFIYIKENTKRGIVGFRTAKE